MVEHPAQGGTVQSSSLWQLTIRQAQGDCA